MTAASSQQEHAASLAHLRAKAALLPLLRRWQAAGVTPLLFKGFHLAEFVYASPGERRYADVDLLLPPSAYPEALTLALEQSWRAVWLRRESLYRYNHEEANLVKNGVLLEPHRFILDTAAPWHSVQTRVTEAAWEASHAITWEGMSVRALHPTDAILMGIILARSWSGGDDWQLKRSDYRDLEVLAAAGRVTQADLEARARELHCLHTTRLFLQRCNPWLGIQETQPPTWLAKQRWQLAITPERGHLGLERALMSASRAPGTTLDALRHLALALRPPDPGGVSATPVLATSFRRKERIVRGVKAAVRLTSPGAHMCLRRSRALYAALARQGYPVRLLVGRDDTGQAHAAIEMDGFSLRDLEDVRPCPPFQVEHSYEAAHGAASPTPATLALAAATPAPSPKTTGDAMTGPDLSETTLLTLSSDQVSVESAEETVILDPISGRYFSLDAVGADAWRLLQEPKRFGALKDALLAMYDAPPDVLERDLRELLGRLLAAGLVTADDETP